MDKREMQERKKERSTKGRKEGRKNMNIRNRRDIKNCTNGREE